MENKKVLMIDKQIDEARKLKINLENQGCRVFISSTPEDGMLITNAHDIDLIIIFDIDTEIIQSLKTNRITASIPILAILDTMYKDSVNNLADYVSDFIFRPYEKEFLYSKMRSLLKIKELQDIIKQKNSELEVLHKQLENMSLIDNTTGLYNSFYLKHIIENECANSRRYGYRLSGIAFDIDNGFDNIEECNKVLKEVIMIVKRSLRQNDTLVRLDSKEFYVLLPHTGRKEAVFVAEKLRKAVGENDFGDVRVTISLGVTSFDEIDRGIRKEDELVQQAREALQSARQKGGNTTECFLQ